MRSRVPMRCSEIARARHVTARALSREITSLDSQFGYTQPLLYGLYIWLHVGPPIDPSPHRTTGRDVGRYDLQALDALCLHSPKQATRRFLAPLPSPQQKILLFHTHSEAYRDALVSFFDDDSWPADLPLKRGGREGSYACVGAVTGRRSRVRRQQEPHPGRE